MLRILIAGLLLFVLAAPRIPATGWTIVHEEDHNGQPFSGDCEPPDALMAENDHWQTIRDGTLVAGDSLTFTHPRPTCVSQAWPGRLAWKWTGHGQAPSIELTLTAPDGQVWTQGGATDVYSVKPGEPVVSAGRVYDVITQKQGKPTYVHMCLFEGPTAGNWTFTIRNIGTTSAQVRVGAIVEMLEWTYTGCVTDSPTYPGYWWPNELSQWGL